MIISVEGRQGHLRLPCRNLWAFSSIMGGMGNYRCGGVHSRVPPLYQTGSDQRILCSQVLNAQMAWSLMRKWEINRFVAQEIHIHDTKHSRITCLEIKRVSPLVDAMNMGRIPTRTNNVDKCDQGLLCSYIRIYCWPKTLSNDPNIFYLGESKMCILEWVRSIPLPEM